MPQLLQQLEAIFIGQAEIEHHHVEFGDLEHRPRLRRGVDVLDRQALGSETGNDTAGDQFIVFANQYVHGGSLRKKVSQTEQD